MEHYSNFKLSKEQQEFADKLIKEAEEKRKLYGGIYSKGNVKLDDDLNVIEQDFKMGYKREMKKNPWICGRKGMKDKNVKASHRQFDKNAVKNNLKENNMELYNSMDERLLIKFELHNDRFDREVFNDYTKEVNGNFEDYNINGIEDKFKKIMDEKMLKQITKFNDTNADINPQDINVHTGYS